MPPTFKTTVSASVWMLFVKGELVALVAVYTAGRAYINGEGAPIVGMAACAAGTFAFTMACVAVWIRRRLEPPGQESNPMYASVVEVVSPWFIAPPGLLS